VYKWCYHIFDPAIDEMFALMDDPFCRFAATPVYKQWLERRTN